MKNKIFLLLVLLTACSSTKISYHDAKATPKERVYAFQDKSPQFSSEIIVVRNYAFGGSGCTALVSINGIKAAEINNEEIVSFYLEPGEHIISYGSGKGFCAEINVIDAVETKLNKGQTKYFRLIDGELLRENL